LITGVYLVSPENNLVRHDHTALINAGATRRISHNFSPGSHARSSDYEANRGSQKNVPSHEDHKAFMM
jgi:hypothetical protein